MSDLIDFLIFRGAADRLATQGDLTWFEEFTVILIVLNNFAWMIFLIILPFCLIAILILLTRRLDKDG